MSVVIARSLQATEAAGSKQAGAFCIGAFGWSGRAVGITTLVDVRMLHLFMTTDAQPLRDLEDRSTPDSNEWCLHDPRKAHL